MIDFDGILFFSPNDQAVVDLLLEKGPLKKEQIIVELAAVMAASTADALTDNLVKRNILSRGPDGYLVRRNRAN